ncbi:MAG TPA: tetratricopeptide repeat protein [Pirellulaceae bacterium]
MAFEELKRRQRIRIAEGYLELLLGFPDKWHLRPENRDRLARRALQSLHGLTTTERTRGHVEYLRGQALRVMELYQDAILPLQRAANADPENLQIHLALGWCFKRVGRLDLAIQALEEAMEFAPEDGIVHYNLACYSSLAGNKPQALQFLSQAFELDSKYRDLVSDEPDFDPLRGDADFQNLLTVIV